MFRPVIKSFKELYTIDGYDASLERQALMLEAPIGIISSAVVFFYSIVNELLEASQNYSKSLLEIAKTTLEKDSSVQNMAGLPAYTHLAEVMLQNTSK